MWAREESKRKKEPSKGDSRPPAQLSALIVRCPFGPGGALPARAPLRA
jgi:hypothetical protein